MPRGGRRKAKDQLSAASSLRLEAAPGPFAAGWVGGAAVVESEGGDYREAPAAEVVRVPWERAAGSAVAVGVGLMRGCWSLESQTAIRISGVWWVSLRVIGAFGV